MQDLKSTLRKRSLLQLASDTQADADICARFLSAFKPDKAFVLVFFWPMKGEPDTRAIACAWHEAGGVCALPAIRTDGQHGLIYKAWVPDAPLVKTRFGTFEPESSIIVSPNIVLVPMLMADQYGNRLGRGAGHYDATLAAKRPQCVVGVVYEHQIYDGVLPHEPHDQKLDMLLSPSELLRF